MCRCLITIGALFVLIAMSDTSTDLALAERREQELVELTFTHADIDFAPDTLNLKSSGNQLTCHIDVGGFSAGDVASAEIVSMAMEGEVYDIRIPAEIRDLEREIAVVKFDRQDLVAYIECLGLESPVNVLMTVTGKLNDGTLFEGEDTIRVVHSGRGECLSRVAVVESAGTHVTLEFSPGYMDFVPVRMADGKVYSAVVDPGSGFFDVGKPAVPVFGSWILIPNGTEVELEIDPGEPLIYEDIDVPPVQPPLADFEGFLPEPPFTMDEVTYNTDADCPGVFAELEPTKVMRGQQCTIIWLYPYQYNPVRRTLSVYPDLTVAARFNGEPSPIPLRLRSESFDLLMRRTALNADAVLSAQDGTGPGDISIAAGPYGWDYIIFTHPKFEAAAKKLADWRTKTGFKALVQVLPEKWQAADIRTALKGAYDSWSTVPKYVLLIGDAEYLPCHYKTWHPYNSTKNFRITEDGAVVKEPNNNQGYTGTDLYYATLESWLNRPEYLPDVAIGRLAVDLPVHAMKIVDRIIEYEKNPPTDSSFYNNAAICAEFQDVLPPVFKNGTATFTRDKYEDKRCTHTSEDLAIFLSDPKYGKNKSVDRIYYTEPLVKPTFWLASTTKSFGGGPAGNAGAKIPSYLWKPKFAWDGDAWDVRDAIQAGRFLVTYRGHGGRRRWRHPTYEFSDVTKLIIQWGKSPVVWCLTCQNGWFDNETDFQKQPGIVDRTQDSEECMSECWQRWCTYGGPVGVIASTRVSYGPYSDRLCWGMIDAIWPDFISTYGSGDRILRMGDVLNYAKEYMDSTTTDDLMRKTHCELYHWFGDPAMQIRTYRPIQIMVAGLPRRWPWALFPKDFYLRANLVDDDGQSIGSLGNARVTLSKADSPSDYWVGKTDEQGNVTFPDLVTSSLGEYDVVVTGPDCIPFQGIFESQAGASGGIRLDAAVYSCSSEIEIKVADANLKGAETLDVSVYATVGDIDGDLDGDPIGGDGEIVTLIEEPVGTGMFVGTLLTADANDPGPVDVVPGENDGILQVIDGGRIRAYYFDDCNLMGDSTWVEDSAVVDCQPPAFDGLNSATAGNGFVDLQWEAASDAHGPIIYNIYRSERPGPPIGGLIGSTWSLSYRDYIGELRQTYYYVVRAQDAVGNEDSNMSEQPSAEVSQP